MYRRYMNGFAVVRHGQVEGWLDLQVRGRVGSSCRGVPLPPTGPSTV